MLYRSNFSFQLGVCMELEQIKVRSFLAKCSPLKELPAEWLDKLAENVTFKCSSIGEAVMAIGKYFYINLRVLFVVFC